LASTFGAVLIVAALVATPGAAYAATISYPDITCTALSANVNRAMRFDPTNQNLYSITETGGSGNGINRLRARSTTPGSLNYYDFYFCTQSTTGDRWWSVRSTANGNWVAAEHGFSGADANLLRARTPTTTIGTWERYQLSVPAPTGPYSVIVSNVPLGGRSLALLTWSTGGYPARYASARFDMPNNGSGNIRGYQTYIGPWETFVVV